MKRLFFALTLLITLTTSPSVFATCDKEILAKNAIAALRTVNASSYLLDKLSRAEEELKSEGYCNGITGALNAISLCVDISLGVLSSISRFNNPMTVREEYDTPNVAESLLAYGNLFISETENPATFNCELKRAVFKSLKH